MAEPAIGRGLLRVVSNSTMVADEERDERDEAERERNEPLLEGLAAYVMQCWSSARDVKRQGITQRLLDAQRARIGEYAPEKLRAIRETGGSEEYARVTANKCRVAESWLHDVYLGQTEKPWTLSATPKPALPPEMQAEVEQTMSSEIAQVFAVFQEPPPASMIQSRRNELEDAIRERMREEARTAVERMERKMHDQLHEGDWDTEWARFLNDLVTYPAAHFKGPILRNRRKVQWIQEGANFVPQVVDYVGVEFERVDPFRCFPSANATSPQDGYFIEHVTFSRSDLHDMIGVEAFDEEAIRSCLQEYGAGGLQNWLGFHDIEDQENQLDGMDRDKGPVFDIDAIEFHGPVRGQDLVDWGMDEGDVPDIDADYEATVWLIGRHVIKAQLNHDPMQTRPYFKACWEELPGSYWGIGLADALSDVQGVVNAAVRSLVNNMAMASGPQVGVNIDRLPPGETLSTLTPWKLWQFQDSQYGSGGAPLEFFQPEMNAREIMEVIEKFYQFADDWSLIPRYMSGNDRVGGAGRTASGLSMLLNAANKGLKGIVSMVDTAVLSPLLQKLYTHNMLFDEDTTLKGDAQVMAKGAVSLMQLETLQLRRNEFLAATANPMDSQIVGLEGRAEILREIAKGLEMDVNRVVPMRGAVGQPQQAPPEAPPEAPPGQPGAPPGGGSDEALMNGAAVTDNFSPNQMRPAQ